MSGLRCSAHSCDDPTGGPEPTADLHGEPAHEDCVAFEESIADAALERVAVRVAAGRLRARDPWGASVVLATAGALLAEGGR